MPKKKKEKKTAPKNIMVMFKNIEIKEKFLTFSSKKRSHTRELV